MPLLFSLGLHRALRAVSDRLLPSQRLLAFLDDICVICSSDRVVSVHVALPEELWAHSRIQVHQDKTQLWNCRGGPCQLGSDDGCSPDCTPDSHRVEW